MAPTTRSKTSRAQIPEVPAHALLSKERHSGDFSGTDIHSTAASEETRIIPIYTIDLSLPPEQRYIVVASIYKPRLEKLTHILDELLDGYGIPRILFHLLACILLRRLHSKEQTEELRGISKVTGLPIYLLISYNVFLDLLMGCTSGGMLVQGNDKRTRMMHFRTLDWGMPELRNVLAIFEYVDKPAGEVVARTVNYVGFVGVLTGVTQGLSISLNFRPYHNNDGSWWSNFMFYIHLLSVLLGFRPSIPSHLRNTLMSNTISAGQRATRRPSHSLIDIARGFPSIPTTAAYLTFCSGDHTIVLEKDRRTANIVSSTTFVAVTNHDVSYETTSRNNAQAAHAKKSHHFVSQGMDEIIAESVERKSCLTRKWKDHCASSKKKKGPRVHSSAKVGVKVETLKEWLDEYPIMNQETHFVAIMDPSTGDFEHVEFIEAESEVDSI